MFKMINPSIYDKNGVVVIEGQDFDLKTDTNRRIYVRNKTRGNNYTTIGKELPQGMTVDEKKDFLYRLYMRICETQMNKKRFGEQNNDES